MKTTKLNTNLLVQYQALEEITVNEANPRTHSDKQIGQIARSIERFDFVNPIIVDGDNKIIAGHGRYMAAKKLRLETVPTIRLSQMSEADIRAYVIADNKLAENAGWDSKLLGLELQYLSNIDLDLTTITGFAMPEIDLRIGDLTKYSESEAADDAIPEVGITPAICQPGDIWKIGNHHLICGDSTKAETYEALLGDKRAQMVFCDAPYNVAINGNVSGLGKIQHREFAMASGEMSQYEFVEFLTTVFNNLVEFSEDGSIHYQCMDFRHMAEILAAGENTYSELKNLCVWVKNNGGMGAFYRSQHELVFVFKNGSQPHINNIQLGKHGRYRTNVWEYAGVNSFGPNQKDLEMHPTVKPVALVADAILDCSKRGGIVLDAFAGSGTTLIAAQKTGRIGYGIEIDPLYCDVIIRRMAQQLELRATCLNTGHTFDELEDRLQEQMSQEVDNA